MVKANVKTQHALSACLFQYSVQESPLKRMAKGDAKLLKPVTDACKSYQTLKMLLKCFDFTIHHIDALRTNAITKESNLIWQIDYTQTVSSTALTCST